jgi:GNAT superfamily N-acetyltransferase
MDTVTVRDREPGDLERCVELLADVHRLDGYPLNWPSNPRRWLCPPELLYAWIAETDNAVVVGHVAVHRPTTPPDADQDPIPALVEIGRLFVAPAFRRHHVATRLLQQARLWAAGHKVDLMLKVVDSQRSTAIAFYERIGWQHTHTTTATWTAPDGGAVTLRRYTLAQDPRDTA